MSDDAGVPPASRGGLRYRRILLKLSGEALLGDRQYGVDPAFCAFIAEQVAQVQAQGVEVGIVVGGGNIFRGMAAAARGMDRATGDYIGMLATVMNGLAMQDALERANVPTRVMTAISMNEVAEPYIRRRAVRHLEKGRVVIFGAGMVQSERRSGISVFNALRHIQAVCVLIFDWFSLFIPIGIVALIAPQIAQLGPDAFAVLAPFAFAFLATSIVLIALPVFSMSLALRAKPGTVFAKLLKPLALAAATRNTLICAPTALETMTDELNAPREPSVLFIPIGFTVMRFGNMVHFIVAALFIANLTGRSFTGVELLFVAAFSFMSSFATIGVSGLPGLVPMAAVLRPFGLSYELALPLMIIADPIVSMIRAMINVALNCLIPALVLEKKRVIAVAGD